MFVASYADREPTRRAGHDGSSAPESMYASPCTRTADVDSDNAFASPVGHPAPPKRMSVYAFADPRDRSGIAVGAQRLAVSV